MKRVIWIIGIIVVSVSLYSVYSFFKPIKVMTTDISEYAKYFSEENQHMNYSFLHKGNVFPDVILESAEVEEFIYYYYNPFDANYLSYLVCSYDEDDYKFEVLRLEEEVDSTDNYLIYGATGFNYPVYAVKAGHSGYRYALGDENSHRIIYVELLFGNYFSDIPYNDFIDPDHLPIGFDALPGNETRKAYEGGN